MAIGPGGRTIKQIEETTGVEVQVRGVGLCHLGSLHRRCVGARAARSPSWHMDAWPGPGDAPVAPCHP